MSRVSAAFCHSLQSLTYNPRSNIKINTLVIEKQCMLVNICHRFTVVEYVVLLPFVFKFDS